MTEGRTALHTFLAVLANAAILAAGWRAAVRLAAPTTTEAAEAGRADRSATWMAFAIIVAASIVVTVQIAGVATLLDRPAMVFALAIALAALLMVASSATRRAAPGAGAERAPIGSPRVGPAASAIAHGRPAPDERRALLVAAVAVLVALLPILCDRIALPPVAWDALTYHLPFVVTWLQRGDLATTVPATGDAAHTYYPLAGQMLLYWNLVSWGGDRWTVLSQLPFLLLGGVAVAAIAVRCGASARVGALAALAWIGTPAALRQSAEVMLDVEQAAFFAVALYFALSSRARGGTRLVPGWLALGLLIGLKYSGIVLALPLLPLLAGAALHRAPGERPRSRWLRLAGGLALAAGVGGYAYLRNAITCGNPLMPLRISFGPWTLLPGPAGAAAYFGAGSHRLGWGALLASPRSILEMGPAFLPLLLLLLFGAWPRRERAPIARDTRVLASIGLGSFLLSAFLLPFREHRYFLPVTAAAWALAAALAEAIGRQRWMAWAVPTVLVAQVPITLAYTVKDAAILGLGPEQGAAMAGIVVAIAAASILWRRYGAPAAPRAARGAAVPIAVAAFAVAAVVLAAATGAAYERSRYARWSWYWGTRHEWANRAHAREDFRDMAAAWAWLAERTRQAPSVVAYAGLNTPFPLSGHGFRNRVVFVPRSGPPEGTLYSWGKPPSLPAAVADRGAWRSNLSALHAGYLCLFRSSAAGGAGAFPIEDEWARGDAAHFDLAWASEYARVYSVRP